MTHVTIKNLLAHKRRLFSTFLAVVLGVAFLSGMLVLTDTVTRTFDDLFADVNRGTDAYIRSANKIESDVGMETRGRIEERLVDVVRPVDGVKAAEPQVLGYGQIVGKDGKALGDPAMGAPTFAGSWSGVPELNPFRLADGRAPQQDGEVVIDRKSAKDGKLLVGDATTLLTPAGPISVTVVGIAKFGSADSAGGASTALMTLTAAERYVSKPGLVDAIAAVAQPGLSQEQLVRRIQPQLPPGVEAITGKQLTKENQDSTKQSISQFVNFFLLPFAAIAVLVSVFSIYNTFTILVAQRAREMALLRALGASKRQVLASIVVEAVLVGFVASIVGLFAGLGVAGLLKALLAQFGLDIPAGSLQLKLSTVIAAFVVGIGVTTVTSVIPGLRASRVPPIAAIRDVAFERTTVSRARVATGAITAVLGATGVIAGVITKGSAGLSRIGIGALLLLVSLIVFGPVVAGPMSRLLGAPIARLRGITGRLAQENARRNPRRTTSAAAALLVGVAVVALFTIFAASIKASIDQQLKRSFAGDLVIDSQTRGFGGFNPALARDLAGLNEVKAATGIRNGVAKINGTSHQVVAVDPATVESVLDLGTKGGSLRDLGTDHIVVSRQYADDHQWNLGQAVEITFPDGATQTFTVSAIYENRAVVGADFALGTAAWSPHATEDLDSLVLVKLKDGVPLAQGKAAVERVAGSYANAKVQDRAGYAATLSGQVDRLLGLVYVMLLLAVVIALMGIANTLALSVYERTRELGLLRAIGESRAQLRSMVRWEGVIIAVFGVIGGLALGTICGWALVTAASESGFATFSFPLGSLLVVLVLGALAGVIAGRRPASRAAKLDILQAIATE